MSIKSIFKDFCKDPTDEQTITLLSHQLYQLTQQAYLRKFNQKKRKNELKGRFEDPELGADDYMPAILFSLIDELGTSLFLRNSLKNKVIETILNTVLPDLEHRIGSNECATNESLAGTYTAWLRLLDLLSTEEIIRPVVKAHHDFKEEVYNLRSHNALLSASEPKKVITETFANETTTLVNNHLEDLYWCYTNLNETNRLKLQSEELGRELNKKSSIAVPQLEEHRYHRGIRLLGKVTFAISAIITAGLALIGKAIYSKITTGHATIFDDHTRSAGKALTAMRTAERFRLLVPIPEG